MGKESHYSSKKDRVFVRAIAGQYSLKEELQRLRSDRKSTRLNSSHIQKSRMPSSA